MGTSTQVLTSTFDWTRDSWTIPSGQELAIYQAGDASPDHRTAFIMVHGHGEHLGRYRHLAERLTDLSLPIVGYDHRGHGASGGPRGDAEGIDELARDLDAVLPHLLERADCDQAILFGHSMGGLVVANYLTHHLDEHTSSRIRGAILSSPAFRVASRPDVVIKVAVGRIVARLWPTATFRTGLNPRNISRDPEQILRYTTDPLVHNLISARLGRSLIDDGEACSRSGHRCRVPTLVYHGTADRIASIEGTRQFVSSIPSDLVDYHELDAFFHEPHHEPTADAERVFALIRRQTKRWLQSDPEEKDDRPTGKAGE